MFFAERIKGIKEGDRVLEIGPGASPHVRSDVLLEKKFESDELYQAQFGNTGKLVTDKKVVFYEGDTFPFKDKEFDYVICSHVLEHVEDVPKFLEEVFRVSAKGYFEYPLIYYEYLYNFDVHLNYLKYNGAILNWMKKTDSGLNEFRPIQDFFYNSLTSGHVAIVDNLLPQMMEGFEWQKPFENVRVKNIGEICHQKYAIAPPRKNESVISCFKEAAKILIRKVIKKG